MKKSANLSSAKRNIPSVRRKRQFLFVLLPSLLLGALFLLGPGCGGKAQSPRTAPNVIILLVDALRLSNLHDYGYARDTDPFLAEFGRQGARFTNAHTQGSHTPIAVASLFTGLLPPVHGVRQAAFLKEDQPDRIVSDVLSSRLTTIAEVLEKRGYSTAAFVANPYISASSGFSKGFLDFHSFHWPETNVEAINAEVLRWLRVRPRTPFFLYVHYMDVHNPFNPPQEYRNRYTEETDLKPISQIGPGKGKINLEKVEFSRDLYDAEINYWDDAFREFAGSLENEGWLKNTLVVILADHGEEFYEHGGFGHGFTVYEEQLHIPLYMIFPGIIRKAEVRDDDAQVIDILPTIGHFTGGELGRLNLPGRSLFPEKGGKKMRPRLSYAETFEGKAPRSIQDGRFKLIYNTEDKTYEFYDLASDPGERNNLYSEVNRSARSLRAGLSRIMNLALKNPQEPGKELDAKTIEELRSLGYIK